MDEELFLTDEQRKQFFEIETTPCEDPVKTVEMTTNGSEYYRNLDDNIAVGLRGLTPDLKEVLRCINCKQTASHATEKL